jgi:hypothetical protein
VSGFDVQQQTGVLLLPGSGLLLTLLPRIIAMTRDI